MKNYTYDNTTLLEASIGAEQTPVYYAVHENINVEKFSLHGMEGHQNTTLSTVSKTSEEQASPTACCCT